MREELGELEGQLVSVRGRVAEYKEHPQRKDLRTILLRNVEIRPLTAKESVLILDHLWFLERHIRALGIKPRRNSRIFFVGSVYSYTRLSNMSKENGKYNSTDYAILPIIQGRSGDVGKKSSRRP